MSMSICEICGKNRKTHKAVIEGAEVEVCDKCHKKNEEYKMRALVSINKQLTKGKKNESIKEEVRQIITEEEIIDDYNERINEAMKKHNMNEEELAKKLNISLSYLKHIILGKMKPDMRTARKIEKLLKIEILKKNVYMIERSKEKNEKGKLFYTLEYGEWENK